MDSTFPTLDHKTITDTICATRTRKGVVQPAMDKYVAKRFVPIEEAKARGWSLYYDGQACRFSHQAARWVSNPDRCSDCVRVREGKPAIYPTARGGNFYEEPRRKETPATPPFVIAAPTPPELDATDKKYLASLAELKDHVKAANAANSTAALIEARRSSNAQFAAACTDLEQRLQITRKAAPSTFTWTQEVRELLMERWIDTGDLAEAQASVGLTASKYFKELENNPAFAAMVEHAQPLAAKALEAVAITQARNGNDKLLTLILKGLMPQTYSDRVRLDVTNKLEDLSDEQLDSQIKQIYTRSSKSRGAIIDAQFSTVVPSTTGTDTCADGNGGALLLSRDGADARVEPARGSGDSTDGDSERRSAPKDAVPNHADLL